MYSLETSITSLGEWVCSECSADLYVTSLKIFFTGTRNSVISGDISNEDVCDISVYHGGKIKDSGDTMSITTANSGGGIFGQCTTTSITETYLTLRIRISSVANTTNKFNSYFIMPVIIDVDKF